MSPWRHASSKYLLRVAPPHPPHPLRMARRWMCRVANDRPLSTVGSSIRTPLKRFLGRRLRINSEARARCSTCSMRLAGSRLPPSFGGISGYAPTRVSGSTAAVCSGCGMALAAPRGAKPAKPPSRILATELPQSGLDPSGAAPLVRVKPLRDVRGKVALTRPVGSEEKGE
jgi:hypothetical protein